MPAGTRRVDPWLAAGLLCSVAALVALALSGHSASRPADRAVAVLFDSLHLGAVGLWIGGLLGLGLVGLPAAKAAGAGQPQVVGEVAGALARAFSTGAQVAMLVVFATGSYLALLQVSAVKELTSTTWGQALTVKIALWVTVLMIATLNAVTLVPRMADRAARSHERWSASEKLGSAMRLELVGGLALVGGGVADGRVPPARGGRGRLHVRDDHCRRAGEHDGAHVSRGLRPEGPDDPGRNGWPDGYRLPHAALDRRHPRQCAACGRGPARRRRRRPRAVPPARGRRASGSPTGSTSLPAATG